MRADRFSRRQLVLGAVGVAGAVLACGACGSSDGDAWQEVTDATSGADFAEVDLALPELARASELVVVGVLGRLIQVREITDGYAIAQLELDVTDVLRGRVSVGTVLAFEGWPDTVEAIPSNPALFFLTEKTSELDPPGIFRWYTSRGIWTSTARADIDTPLADEPPSASPLYADDIRHLKTLDEVVELVR